MFVLLTLLIAETFNKVPAKTNNGKLEDCYPKCFFACAQWNGNLHKGEPLHVVVVVLFQSPMAISPNYFA